VAGALTRNERRGRRAGHGVEVRGFEPLASSVRGKRSTGLSHTPRFAVGEATTQA
jgi:hypothetical protein